MIDSVLFLSGLELLCDLEGLFLLFVATSSGVREWQVTLRCMVLVRVLVLVFLASYVAVRVGSPSCPLTRVLRPFRRTLVSWGFTESATCKAQSPWLELWVSHYETRYDLLWCEPV